MKYLYIILSIVLVSNLFSAEISSPLLYKVQDFDVLHYDATIEFSENQRKLIYAKNNITVHWLNRTDESKFYFHLRSLSVDKVEYNGKPVDFKIVGVPANADYHYYITPPPDDSKDTAVVTIFYHGIMQNEGGMNPWGGVHDRIAIFALGVGFYCNYVSTTQHWLACYDHPSDKATFKFTFINPLSKFIVSNGFGYKTKVESKDAFVYSSDNPIATYLMTFADFNYVEHILDYKIPIKIFAAEKYSNSIQKVFGKLPEVVDAYEDLFGDYPFEMIGYVLTPIGSMESQMMINLDENIINIAAQNPDTFNLTIAHELSHQWFGNSVTPYDFRDAYLNESWATYCESLLLEKLFDKNAYLAEQEKKSNSYIKQIAPYEGYLSLYDFSRKSPSSNYPTTIYYKGAVVLGMLRHLMAEGKNDKVFFDFIKDYLRTYKNSNVSTLDFLKMVLKYHQDTLAVNRFFDSWIYRIGYPKLNISLVRNINSSEEGKYQDIAIQQNNPKSWGIFSQIPIPIRFIKENKTFDTLIWIEEGTSDYIYLSKLLGGSRIYFDTLYFNKGYTARSLFTIDNIQLIDPVKVDDTSCRLSFSIFEKVLSIKTSEFHNDLSLNIYDLFGRLVNQSSFDFVNSINMDLNYLPSGFYNFVILKNGNLIYKNKFILN